MFKVEARPTLKLKYFNCKKGEQHQGQVLNYVCIQKTCKDKGLICSICKHDHSSHNVVPLKYLIGALKNHKQQPLESQSFQSELEQLQYLKNSFLYELKTIVQNLSQKIQKIEQQIIEKFKNRKVELLNQIQIKMKFNEIIDSTLNNNLEDQQAFENDFKIIASLIESTNYKKQQSTFLTNHFYFSINLNKIVKEYEQSYKSFSKKINKFFTDSQPVLSTLMEDQASVQKQSISKVQTVTINTQTKQYKFSPTQKGLNLKILNDNKTAECVTAGNQRFALIDGNVQKKGSVIRFKVEKLKNWVGFGLAIRNIIVDKKYQFLYNNLGHGSFLISTNGYTWSHAYTANNIQNSDFSFVQGNIIKVEVNETELIFTNESQQNKVKKLPILLNENEWKQACFCVNLCSIGDSATIL